MAASMRDGRMGGTAGLYGGGGTDIASTGIDACRQAGLHAGGKWL